MPSILVITTEDNKNIWLIPDTPDNRKIISDSESEWWQASKYRPRSGEFTEQMFSDAPEDRAACKAEDKLAFPLTAIFEELLEKYTQLTISGLTDVSGVSVIVMYPTEW